MATVEPPEILQGEEPRMTYQEWVKTKEGQEATKGKYAEKVLDNGGEGGIIEVGKSLSASAKNYPVRLPDSRQHVKLAEGQTIIGKAFAGKGTTYEIKDRFKLENKFNIPADKWKKMSGKGKVIIKGKEKEAELHWYEANGIIYDMKVKRYLDES